MMEAAFQSGNIAFALLILMAAEMFLLRRYLRNLPFLALGLCAGACLVLALRAALLQQGWMVIGSFMALSFVFHLLEIQQCLRLAKRLPLA